MEKYNVSIYGRKKIGLPIIDFQVKCLQEGSENAVIQRLFQLIMVAETCKGIIMPPNQEGIKIQKGVIVNFSIFFANQQCIEEFEAKLKIIYH